MILQIGRPISGWRLATGQDNHRVTRSISGEMGETCLIFWMAPLCQRDVLQEKVCLTGRKQFMLNPHKSVEED